MIYCMYVDILSETSSMNGGTEKGLIMRLVGREEVQAIVKRMHSNPFDGSKTIMKFDASQCYHHL